MTKVAECIMQRERPPGRVRVPGVNWNSGVEMRAAVGERNSGGLLHFQKALTNGGNLGYGIMAAKIHQREGGGGQIAPPPLGGSPRTFQTSDEKKETSGFKS